MMNYNTTVLDKNNTKVVCFNNTFVLDCFSMKYGDRLRLAREHKGLSQDQLVELSGVKQGTISKIERGDQNSSGFDAELSYALNIEAMWLKTGDNKFIPDWLATGKEEKCPAINKSNLSLSSQLENNKLGIIRVPLIDFNRAGSWREELSNHVPSNGDPMITDEVGEHVFAVCVPGDSMRPEFDAGETILIDPDSTPEHKDYVLVEVGGDVVLRQYWREAGAWRLKPLNERYDLELLGNNPIIGVVIEKVIRKKYK